MMSRILIPTFFLVFFLGNECLSQENNENQSKNNNNIELNIDLASRYLWRGIALSNTACLQPSLTFSFGGFSVNTWGSYSISSADLQEADITFSYSYKKVKFSLADYFSPDEVLEKSDYLNYSKDSTRHLLDVQFGWNEIGGSAFNFLFSTFIYGDDKKPNSSENYYSVYGELSYTKNLGDISLLASIGLSPYEGFYSSKFNVVNIGLSAGKTLNFNDKYGLPITVGVYFNPEKEKIFISGIISF